MLGALLPRVIPSGWYGAPTAFPVLSGLEADLLRGDGPDTVTAALDRAKHELYGQLRGRFTARRAQALTLKALNICVARQHFQARDTSVGSRPIGLVVDPSNLCQLGCPGCVHSPRAEALQIVDWPKGTLTIDRFAALMERYGSFAVGVYFCNYGEPLLNLATPRFIRLAKGYLAWTALSTSLSVRRLDAEAYVESGLDFMALSIDGATQRVYERFRRGGDLECTLSNLRKLVDAKRRMRKRTPVLAWNFLAFEHNAHEIPLARSMARKLGADQFRVVNPFDVGWDDPEIRPAAVEAGVQRFDWLTAVHVARNWDPLPNPAAAEVIERAFESPWSHEVSSGNSPNHGHTCHWLYKNMVMDATGRILPCCGAPGAGRDLVFGEFEAHTGDPFNTDRHREARTFFRGDRPASDAGPHCVRCEWDQTTVNIGGEEIRRYFLAADPAFFDRRSLTILGDW
ncbi:MAG: radical SAM/SPASM domain-containing protein [Bryobacteraceae bacterium]